MLRPNFAMISGIGLIEFNIEINKKWKVKKAFSIRMPEILTLLLIKKKKEYIQAKIIVMV
jgi:hypothetical protein